MALMCKAQDSCCCKSVLTLLLAADDLAGFDDEVLMKYTGQPIPAGLPISPRKVSPVLI